MAREAEPERLRADLLDFARSQLSSQVKSKAAGGAGTRRGRSPASLRRARASLSQSVSQRAGGRAVARTFHKMASPAFPSKEWKDNRYWGQHLNVDFEVLRQMDAGWRARPSRRCGGPTSPRPRRRTAQSSSHCDCRPNQKREEPENTTLK